MEDLDNFLTILECDDIILELDGGTVSYEQEREGNNYFYKVAYPSGNTRFLGLKEFWEDMKIACERFEYELIKVNSVLTFRCYSFIK